MKAFSTTSEPMNNSTQIFMQTDSDLTSITMNHLPVVLFLKEGVGDFLHRGAFSEYVWKHNNLVFEY